MRFSKALLFILGIALGVPAYGMPRISQRVAGDAQQMGAPTYYLNYANGLYYGFMAGFPNVGSGTSSSLRNGSILQENYSGAAANTIFTRECGTASIQKVTNQYQLRISPSCGLWTEGTTACSGAGCVAGGTGSAKDNVNFVWYNRDWTCAGNCATNAPNNQWVATSATVTKDQTGADGSATSATSVSVSANNGKVCQAFGIPVSNATIQAAGTAYTANDILTTVGGTCTTQPTLKVLTVTGGVPQTISINTIGLCQTLPSNPVSVTGGTGTGFTANLLWQKMPQSAYIKRITGTGTVNLSLDDTTYTDFSGSINSSTYTRAILSPIAAPTSPKFCLKLGTSGDKVAVDFAQAINSDAGEISPILTTNATNLLGDEMPAFNTPSGSPVMQNAGYSLIETMYQGRPFSMLIIYSGNFGPSNSHLLFGTDGASSVIPFVTGAAGGGVITVAAPGSGTLTSTGTDVSGLGTINKVLFSCYGGGCKVCVNGVGPDKSTTIHAQWNAASANLTHAGQLNNGSGLLPTNGYTQSWYAWDREVTDLECTQYTKSNFSYLQK